MAQKTVVTLVDDLDGSEADQTVEFGLDGVYYEVDLSDGHASSLRDSLADYVAHARRQRGRQRTRTAAASSSAATRNGNGAARSNPAPSTVDREQNRAIREWARKQGVVLSDRGRIPSTVTEAFHRGDASALSSAAASASSSSASSSSASSSSASGTPAAEAPAAGGDEKTGPDGLTSSEREQIRSWAQDQGIEVKSRGRLTKDLIANYRATTARA